MNTICNSCGVTLDDADRSTICPHPLIMPADDLAQKKAGLALMDRDICFAHEPDGLVRRVQYVTWNGMVGLHGMSGEFAPHLFVPARGAAMTARETWRRVFATRAEAEEFLRERGFSVGRMQGASPRGILLGDWDIQKWRNLSRADREVLHGVMQRGPIVDGPVTVTISAFASVEAHIAIRQNDMVPA